MKKGWEIKTLDEVCTIKGRIGYRGYTKQDLVEEGEGAISLSPSNIKDNQIIYKKCTYISWFKYDESPEIKIFDGDIIYCKTASIGKIALIENLPEKATINPQFVVLKELKCSSKYLFFFMNSREFKEQERQIIGGTAIPTLSQANLGNLKIPIPSLPEQQRIVAILDEAFAAIAKAKANAEQNLKNAKELFESYLQGVFENKGEGWEEKKLIEITNKIGSGSTPRGGNESYKTEGISLVRSMNVHDFEFRERNLAFIDDKQAKELNNVTLQEDDVLLNITGASVARCCIIPSKHLPARVNQHVSIIRAKREIIDPIFLNLLLTSKFYKDQLLFTGEQGATRQAITKAQLEVFKVAFPKSIKEQKSLMNRLEALSIETKKLEAIYQTKINDLEELKKSVLQKAFNGELKTSKVNVVA